MARRSSLLLFLFILAFADLARADAPQFDLSGPRIDVRVTRAGKSLPISQVPNLQPGDQLWLRPDLPASQSVHYLLIPLFLRGSTNPPSEKWFTKVETWNKRIRKEGIVVTVPAEAQQALLLLAPQTGGDFSTLRSAVQGRPGSFVRASQDLNQASLDRARLDKYLAAVKEISSSDLHALHDRCVLLARSLNIKLDDKCFDKPTEQQAPCLMQDTGQLVLEDGHSQSMVATLTSGPASDLMQQLSASNLAGSGAYSPYVGAALDVIRLLENFRTAQYQYIPALALPVGEELNLKLNNPPSFHKPMSVLVAALPAVEASQLPPVRAVERDRVFCLQKPALVLPVEGAPLIFATRLAHDLEVHGHSKSGEDIYLPVRADPGQGGLVVDAHSVKPGSLDAKISGTVRGAWGFDHFEGPIFDLRNSQAASWTLPATDKNALIVGREDELHLQSDEAACVHEVEEKDQQGKTSKAIWKIAKPNEVEIRVALKDAAPGPVKLLVKQYGESSPDEVAMRAYSESGHLDQLAIHAGDTEAVLKGTRLDEVAGIELNGIHFAPGKLSRKQQKDELSLSASDDSAARSFYPEEKLVAHVALKDGRVLDLQATVEPMRPKVSLINKSIQPGQASSPAAIRLSNSDDLPLDGHLSFLVKSEVPGSFPRTEKNEVASADESFRVLLSVADGNLIVQDAQSVLAVLDPLKSFGASAFGPLRFRPVNEEGAVGDWQSLVTLVRVPSLKEVHCPGSPDRQCTLIGSSLFLIDSVASDAQFSGAVSVPQGFADSSLSVPRPNGTLLYIKLRDDPSAINPAALPVMPEP